MTDRLSGFRRVAMAAAACCLLIVQVVGPVATARAGTPANDLKQIQYRYYFRGQYDRTIGALNTYLARTDLTAADQRTAREFLAASYVLAGRTEEGKGQFVKMLQTDGNYAGPDSSVFRAEVVHAYDAARNELASALLKRAPDLAATEGGTPIQPVSKSKPIYKKWWFYAGLVAVVVVVGAATSKGDETPPAQDSPTGTVSVGVTVQ